MSINLGVQFVCQLKNHITSTYNKQKNQYELVNYSLHFLKIFFITVPTNTKEDPFVWGIGWVK